MGMDSGRVPPGMNPMNRLTPPGGRLPNPQSALSQMGNYSSSSSQVPPQANQGPPGMRGQPPPSQMGPQISGPNAALSPMPQMNMPPNQARWSGPQSVGPTSVT
jgi:hypothetical protein